MQTEKEQETCCKSQENELVRSSLTKIKTFLFYFQTLPKENTPPTTLLLRNAQQAVASCFYSFPKKSQRYKNCSKRKKALHANNSSGSSA